MAERSLAESLARRAWVALPLLAALLARVVGPFETVLGGATVVLLGNDPYFHLRQVRYASAHFPHLQRFDTLTNYPYGEANRTAGLFDWSLGLLGRVARSVGINPGRELEALLLALAPPLLALVCLFLVYRLLCVVHGERAGFLGLAFCVLFPGEFLEKSCLGFGDHHVAEVLLVLWSLLAWTSDRELAGRGGLRSALATALPLCLLTLTWSGAAVYFLAWVLAAGVTVVWAHGPAHPLSRARAWRRSLAGGALVALLLACLLLLPELVPWPATFGLAILGALGLLFVEPTWAMAAPRQSRSRLRTALALCMLALVVGYALYKAFPDWGDRLLATKSPLVNEQRAVTLSSLWRDLAVTALFSPVALYIAFRQTTVGPRERGLVFATTLSCIVGALWVATGDYGYLAAVLLALNAAVVLAELTAPPSSWRRRVLRGLTGALGARSARGALAVVASGTAAICVLTTAPPYVGQADARAMLVARRPWLDVARWLAEHTPSESKTLETPAPANTHDFQYPKDAYGVLCMWDFGNLLAAEARRPVVASQRLSEKVADFFLSDETRGVQLIEEGCRDSEQVRYVVVDASTLIDKFASLVQIARRPMTGFTEISADGLPRYSQSYDRTLGALLLHRGGSTLGRFRLLYDSPDYAYRFYEGYVASGGQRFFEFKSVPAGRGAEPLAFDVALANEALDTSRTRYDRSLVPAVRVFEVVRGARLVGHAPPGSRLHAIITLEGDGVPRRAVGYSAMTAASGEFSLHVAHATSLALSATVKTAPTYALYLEEGAQKKVWAHASVSDEDVMQGRPVQVLDLERP